VKIWRSRSLNTDPNIICFKSAVPDRDRIDLSLPVLLESLKFDKWFNNTDRFTAYYGHSPYKYSGTEHKPVSIFENVNILNLYNIIRGLFPNCCGDSILINYYPRGRSFLPFHADDEPEINPMSHIITLSLGGSRRIGFRLKSGNGPNICTLRLNSWDVLIFSKRSQFMFKHSILKEDHCTDARISFTIRQLI